MATTSTNETLLHDLVVAGRYRIERVIAEGTTGHLFRARRLSDDRVIALKCGSIESEMSRTSLRVEAQALAALDHPNIVRFLEHREGRDLCFLAMEHLDGVDLAARMRQAPVTRAQAMLWLHELASALDHVHAAGLVHRDIKPANVMIVRASDGVEHAVLIDFGLASPRTTRKQRTRFLCGTPAYMAPEQALGNDADVSAATDRYALAAVALELVTGHRPYPNGSIPELLRRVMQESPRAPSELGDFDARVDEVFAKALAREPRARFASCEASIAAIEASLPRPRRARPSRAPKPGKTISLTARRLPKTITAPAKAA
ncbi:MAG: serine/threonine protein kinase [Sandaracinaceae bacterium]|nr:serine/threonine protein kinase [Sandaracinaceae bacterium]